MSYSDEASYQIINTIKEVGTTATLKNASRTSGAQPTTTYTDVDVDVVQISFNAIDLNDSAIKLLKRKWVLQGGTPKINDILEYANNQYFVKQVREILAQSTIVAYEVYSA